MEEELDIIVTNHPKHNKKPLKRRSSVAIQSAVFTFEDRLSAITNLPPDERLRKLYEMCVRETGRTLSERPEFESLSQKLILNTIIPFKSVIPESELTELSKSDPIPIHIRNIRRYTERLQSEQSRWKTELERRKKDYLESKFERRRRHRRGIHDDDDVIGPEMSTYLNGISDYIERKRNDLKRQRLYLRCIELKTIERVRRLKRKLEIDVESSINDEFRDIKMKTDTFYLNESV